MLLLMLVNTLMFTNEPPLHDLICRNLLFDFVSRTKNHFKKLI